MSITITDPTLQAQLAGATGPVELKAPDGRILGILTPQRADAIIAAARRLAENPLFEEWVRAVEEYRRVHNTVPDPD